MGRPATKYFTKEERRVAQRRNEERFREAHRDELRVYQKNYQMAVRRAKGVGPRKPAQKPLCHPERTHGAHGLCKPCYEQIRWTPAKKTERESARLRRLYGITPEQIAAMTKVQDGRCAACRERPKGWATGKLQVDHDHVTGKIRGLLCERCNTLLGQVGDSTQLLQLLIEYLEGYCILSIVKGA